MLELGESPGGASVWVGLVLGLVVLFWIRPQVRSLNEKVYIRHGPSSCVLSFGHGVAVSLYVYSMGIMECFLPQYVINLAELCKRGHHNLVPLQVCFVWPASWGPLA